MIVIIITSSREPSPPRGWGRHPAWGRSRAYGRDKKDTCLFLPRHNQALTNAIQPPSQPPQQAAKTERPPRSGGRRGRPPMQKYPPP